MALSRIKLIVSISSAASAGAADGSARSSVLAGELRGAHPPPPPPPRAPRDGVTPNARPVDRRRTRAAAIGCSGRCPRVHHQ